ncbi:5-aminolevulic acid synthase [Acidimangrovimonas sediminis]|uniref:5-aminolevulic acid synthase n=1 Tax=Acidimangrovimonas sediminis TaxID=2056283 RepID=UPI000C80767B|nr:5-aminolevulic acid synthase [Acidimangrovimonas sediminis]
MTHRILSRAPMAAAAALTAALLIPAVAAQAAPLQGAQAKGMLYPAKGAEVQVMKVPGFGRKETEVLRTVGASQKYYGAIAVSPGDGLLNEATVAAANYHSIEPAERAALAACDARKSAKARCVVAARILPKGYRPGRALQLSADATQVFDEKYLSARAPKALAISRSSGLFGLGLGAGAEKKAVQACRAKAQQGQNAADCAVIIAE